MRTSSSALQSNRITTRAALAVAFLCIQSAIAQDSSTFPIRGRVVDPLGQPVANIEIGTSWSFQGDSASPRWRSGIIAQANASLRTDADGKFSGTLFARRPTVALFALDMDKKAGGVFLWDRDNPDKECTLRIGPLVHLHGKVQIEEAKLRDSPHYIYVTDTRARIAIASSVSKDRDFSFFMPPSEYEVSFSAKDLEKITMGVLLNNKERELDLGTIALSPTNLARHYGKAPPAWNLTATRGVRPDITLADYHGRWVLLEFWAYW